MTAHDYRTYIAMVGISALAALAMVLAVGDGLVAAAITALAGLGGYSVAKAKREG